MKKKFVTLLVVGLTGLLFLAVGALSAADQPNDVLIKGKDYKKDKKGPVEFTHEKHSKDYKVACTDCHHDYKDGKNVWKEGKPVEKCKACHNPKKKEGKVMKLQNAYHRNCKNCHKALAKEGKKTGPYKKCTKCHQKKKK
ncbi:MAG: cytochrome c3 family protein [Desulfobacteraceae bacterium]|nr:cytochrome c3 family protein [Desulfobacteraceae bacterium]